MTASISLWYAVNGSGQGIVFTNRPERDEKRKVWLGEVIAAPLRFMDYMETERSLPLPNISWSDECVEITVNVSYPDYEE